MRARGRLTKHGEVRWGRKGREGEGVSDEVGVRGKEESFGGGGGRKEEEGRKVGGSSVVRREEEGGREGGTSKY